MMKSRIEEQFDFLREIDKEKEILRQTYLADGSRREDDAEHAWHLAMMVMVLGEYSNGPIDRCHTMEMVLIHDLIEIYAGDTYAYDADGNKTKRERELKAADRLFAILPQDQGQRLRALWDEFEENSDGGSTFCQYVR
jgi:putative hydrolase of HD superfamily